MTSQYVESNIQFLLNTSENVYFNINPSSTGNVDTEIADLNSRQVKKDALISHCDTDNEKITGDTTYFGKRKYMHNYIYDDPQPVTCDFVLDDINITTMYVVPLQTPGKMNNCKGITPWGYD